LCLPRPWQQWAIQNPSWPQGWKGNYTFGTMTLQPIDGIGNCRHTRGLPDMKSQLALTTFGVEYPYGK